MLQNPTGAGMTSLGFAPDAESDGVSLTTLGFVTGYSSPVVGLCSVLFRHWSNSVPVEGAIVRAYFVGQNVISANVSLAQIVAEAETDSQGRAELRLVRYSAIISGTRFYNIRIIDPDGKISQMKNTVIPDRNSCLFSELPWPTPN